MAPGVKTNFSSDFLYVVTFKKCKFHIKVQKIGLVDPSSFGKYEIRVWRTYEINVTQISNQINSGSYKTQSGLIKKTYVSQTKNVNKFDNICHSDLDIFVCLSLVAIAHLCKY